MSKTTQADGPGGRGIVFPTIGLKQAIERVRQLESKEKRSFTRIGRIFEIWDYSPKSSGARQTLGTIRSYGLLDFQGRSTEREARISERAYRILHSSPDANELMQSAALDAPWHKAMWEHYKEDWPPSDDNVKDHILWTLKLKLTPKVAQAAAAQFKATIEFAKLNSSAILPPKKEDENGKNDSIIDDKLPQVGDYVQWTSQGAVQFRKPRRVVNIDENDGEGFVMVSGARSAIPASEVEVIQGYTPPPFEQALAEGLNRIDPSQPGMKTEVTTIGPHQATLAWPARLTQNEYDDLKYWLDGVLLKAQRDIGLGNTRSDAAVAHDEDNNAPAK